MVTGLVFELLLGFQHRPFRILPNSTHSSHIRVNVQGQDMSIFPQLCLLLLRVKHNTYPLRLIISSLRLTLFHVAHSLRDTIDRLAPIKTPNQAI